MQQRFAHYNIIAEMARGTTSTTYLAISETQPEQKVIVRTFPASAFTDPLERQRMLQVAETLKNLRYPHLVAVLAAGSEEGQVYVTSEYVSGGSLRVRLDRTYPRTLPFHQALTVISQIGQALSTLHTAQLVHGHLKPESILFNAHDQALLGDAYLGNHISLEQDDHEKAAYALRYCAPEQLQETRAADALSDQYALCCIAYELLTGGTPFSDTDRAILTHRKLRETPLSLQSYIPSLSATIDAAVLKGLNREPAQRHADISTFLTLLQPTQPSSQGLELPLPRSKRAGGHASSPLHISSPSPRAVFQTPSGVHDPSTPADPVTQSGTASGALISPTPSLSESRTGQTSGAESDTASKDNLPTTPRAFMEVSAPEQPSEKTPGGPVSDPRAGAENAPADAQSEEAKAGSPAPATGEEEETGTIDKRHTVTPVDEARKLLLYAPVADGGSPSVSHEGDSVPTLKIASNVQTPKPEQREQDDDATAFDTLLENLALQEKLFLARVPDLPQNKQLPVAQAVAQAVVQAPPSQVQQHAPAGAATPIFPLPQAFPSKNMGSLRNAAPPSRHVPIFKRQGTRGKFRRFIPWVTALVLLTAGLVAYSMLANASQAPLTYHGTDTTPGSFHAPSSSNQSPIPALTHGGQPAPTPAAGQPTPTAGSTSTPTPALTPTPPATSTTTPASTPTPGPVISTLSGAYQEYNTFTNLTSVGNLDWVHWGLNSAGDVNRKNNGAYLISNYGLLQGGSTGFNNHWPIDFGWSDGSPIGGMVTTTSCIYVQGQSNGFSISVPADTSPRTLRMYVGVYRGRGLLSASIQGGPSYSDASLVIMTDSDNALYTLTFTSSTPGTRLYVSWSLMTANDSTSYVMLESAALSG